MIGPTTSGLAALIGGEAWLYVGTDSSFESGWENAGSLSDLAYRAISAGTEIRVYGAILNNGAASSTVTTLPEGYRPDADSFGLITVSIISSMGAYRGGLAWVADDGALVVPDTDTGDTVVINGTYPISPPEVTP